MITYRGAYRGLMNEKVDKSDLKKIEDAINDVGRQLDNAKGEEAIALDGKLTGLVMAYQILTGKTLK